MPERRLQRRRLAAGERESGSVRDVDGDDPVGGEQRRHLAVELDAGHMSWGAGAREHVDDHEVDGAAQAGRELFEHRARIAVPHPDRRLLGQRQLGAHEVDDLAL